MSTETEAFAGQVTELGVDLYDGEATRELRLMDSDSVNAVLTFDEAIAQSGFNVEDITYLGSPFTILQGDDKAQLIGVPFFIRSWRFTTDQDTDRPYVVLHLITRDNAMFILTDGSTGIRAQLEKVTADRMASGVGAPFEQALVPNGLRVSEYATLGGQPVKKGEKPDGKARTFYLA